MVVVVAASVKGAAVEFFTFRNEQIRKALGALAIDH